MFIVVRTVGDVFQGIDRYGYLGYGSDKYSQLFASKDKATAHAERLASTDLYNSYYVFEAVSKSSSAKPPVTTTPLKSL